MWSDKILQINSKANPFCAYTLTLECGIWDLADKER